MKRILEVRNDTNSVQIDENYANLQLVKKGTAVCVSPGDTKFNYKATVQITDASTPLLAFRAFSPVAMVGVIRQGSTWTFKLCSRTNNTSFDYYIFDRLRPPTGPGYGLQVFDANSNMILDARYGVMRVVDFINQKQDFTRTYAPDRVYAVCEMVCPKDMQVNILEEGNRADKVYNAGCLYMSDSTITAKRYEVGSTRITATSKGIHDFYTRTYTALVIDVTYM